MNEKVKSIIAFSLLAVFLIVGAVLTWLDRPTDVFPDENTMIQLYGETHGVDVYYQAELLEWQKCYAQGERNLFVELPYYTAEFLNVWMHEDNDAILDQIFEDIQGTASGVPGYAAFFRSIKETCPDTVFYGTDVGHLSQTTGARYLQYLEENGLQESENYALAEMCIQQGEAYRAANDSDTTTGISPVRESYMVSNFIDAYTRCGGGKIMGIYGSYHTDLRNPELMAGQLQSHYGDIISSVKLSTLLSQKKPYTLGFCVTGLVFLLMLYIPNTLWAVKKKPVGYDEYSKRENKLLVLLERIGEAGVSVVLLIFTDFNPCITILPTGLYFEMRILFWVTAFLLMILYECYWVRYFRSAGTMQDFYSSFAGFPIAGASLPVMASILLGVYSQNLLLLAISVILGIGHIGIHAMHRRETEERTVPGNADDENSAV